MKIRHIAVTVVLLITITFGIISDNLGTQTVHAQQAAEAAAATTVKTIWEKIEQALLKAWKVAKSIALDQAANTFINNLAYETAAWISSAAPGGEPLERRASFGSILQKSGEAALGDFIGTIASESGLKSLGLDLCNPSAQVKLNISLGLLDKKSAPQPKCDINKVREKWRNLKPSVSVGVDVVRGDTLGLLAGSASFNGVTYGSFSNQKDKAPGIPWLDLTTDLTPIQKLTYFKELMQQSDLKANVLLAAKADEIEQLKKEAEKLSLEQCQGFKDNPAPVNNDIILQTCNRVHQIDEKQGEGSQGSQDKVVEAKSAGEDGFWVSVGKMFAKTLGSQLLEKYIKGGVWSLTSGSSGSTSSLSDLRSNIIKQLRGGSVSPTGTGSLPIPLINQRPLLNRIADYDYLTELVTCPQDRTLVSLDNCTLDADFQGAINDKSTVAEALADGRLRSQMPLLSGLNSAANADPFCLRDGYCQSNLERLRKYRIIPVGWEIAASLSPLDSPITLGEAVACFDDGPGCPLSSESNVYFHLVDPNWVLKAPEAQCQAETFGPLLASPQSNERQKYCADVISCLGEDDDNNCIGGFGYCTQERSIWRFTGTQCLEQHASCDVYTNTTDESQAYYLGNTLDYCNASQSGCMWYSISQDNIGSLAEPVYAWNPDDRIFFNDQVQECQATDGGCSEYISVLTPGVNVLPNGDFNHFEASSNTNFSDPDWINDDLADEFDGWIIRGGMSVLTTGNEAFSGGVGARILGGTGQMSTSAITGVLTDKSYTLSWYAKLSALAPSTSCDSSVSMGSTSRSLETRNLKYEKGWKRYSLTQTYDVNNIDTAVNIVFNSCDSGEELFIDAIQFEFNTEPSAFRAYGEGGKFYAKSQFQCTKEDVGCNLYTPDAGGFAVPGKITSSDICPQECVGYQSYLELVNSYDLIENPTTASRPVDLIATTGPTCPAEQVGCEEFTNLDEVELGGEGKYYYSELRQCVDDPFGVTFYTLEGSDTAGYQVRTWRLLPTNLGGSYAGAPCTNIDANGSTCLDIAPPALGENVSQTHCSEAVLATNLDCREYFDLDGLPHYVLQSRVIAASTDCSPLRRSATGIIFNGLQSESRACVAAYNNCREYRGNQANNQRTIFADDFETRSITPWFNETPGESLRISSEAPTTGGNSMRCFNNGAVNCFAVREFDDLLGGQNNWYYINLWAKSTASALGTTIQLQIDVNDDGVYGATEIFDFLLSFAGPTDWQHYTIGPIAVNIDGLHQARIGFIMSPLPNESIYVDNFELSEAKSNLYLLKDQWRTPLSCDTPRPGAMLGCQAYTDLQNRHLNLRSFSELCGLDVIGCQSFIDTHNSTDPFQQIFLEDDPAEVIVPADDLKYIVYNKDNFCFAANKGCSLVGQPEFNRDLPIAHPKYITGYTERALINNPDSYGLTLCQADALFCEEYTSGSSELTYFKSPGNRICAYKENINIEGQIVTGWFQVRSLQPGQTPKGCSDNGIDHFADSAFELHENVEIQYDRWVGQCPSSDISCTEFVDTRAGAGGELLVNADLSQGATVGWTLVKFGPNGLTDAEAYEVDSLAHYARIQSDNGGTSIYQDLTELDPTLVYTFSTTAIVSGIAVEDDSYVRADIRCAIESSRDGDDAINLDGYCENPGAGTYTDVICTGPADPACDTAEGEICNMNWQDDPSPWKNPVHENRDRIYHNIDTAKLDSVFFGKQQPLSVVVDLGPDINRDELRSCIASLTMLGGDSIPAGLPSVYNDVFFENITFQPAKPYFYLDNDQIDSASCNGLIGENESCLLFLDNGDQSRLHSAKDSFERSVVSNNELVSPVRCDPADGFGGICYNDTNRIIKVERDRECAEWLSCRSTTEVFDSTTNSYRRICDQVGTCNKFSTSDSNLNCLNWVTPDRERLDYAVYVTRDLSFNAIDYTGYSAYDQYAVGTLDLVDVSNNKEIPPGPDGRHPDYRLVRVIDTCDSSDNYEGQCGPIDRTDPSDPPNRIGRCFATDKCLVGIDGTVFNRASPYVVPLSTRAYAEDTSPVPHSVVISETGIKRSVKFGFQSSNLCENKNASCELRYYKFQYGSGVGLIKYYSADLLETDVDIPGCICEGGTRADAACLEDEDENDDDDKITSEDRCPNDGTPAFLRQTDSYLNWPGYCLQPDFRASINGSPNEFACLNWLPVDSPPAGFDFFNQDREAGYSDKFPAYYCLEVGLFEYRARHLIDCQCSGNFLGTPIFNWVFGIDTDPDVPGTQTDYEVQKGGRCGDCNGGFNHKYKWYGVPVGGNGYYSFNGIYECNKCDDKYKELGPDPTCQVLAEAVDPQGENAALTNRFWSGYDGGVGYTITTLNYKYDYDDQPFGSAVPNALIGFITTQLEIKGKQEIPRAGYPYACSSSAESCALFDQDSQVRGKVQVAVEGFTVPPYPGEETYIDGIQRLKEIYAKIFRLYKYQEKNSCDYAICTPRTQGSTGNYFGGKLCELADENSCFTQQAKCVRLDNVCVNSIFNIDDDDSPLKRTCNYIGPNPDVFESTRGPDRRWRSILNVDPATVADLDGDGTVNEADYLIACNNLDLDLISPGTDNCSSYGTGPLGYECQLFEDNNYYCAIKPFYVANNCDVPIDPSTGNLITSQFTCQANATGQKTCHYGGVCSNNYNMRCTGDAICQATNNYGTCIPLADTGGPCNVLSDCTAPPSGDVDSLAGLVHSMNDRSFCADTFKEGEHDFEAGKYCLGAPFTTLLNGINTYIIDTERPVLCDGAITNELGHLVDGDGICEIPTDCQPANHENALLADDSPVCVARPASYTPLCDEDTQNCDGIASEFLLADEAKPLDKSGGVCYEDDIFRNILCSDDRTCEQELAAASGLPHCVVDPDVGPQYAPYMVAAVCDDNGIFCTPWKPNSTYQIPRSGPYSATNDNSFSLNNIDPDQGSPGQGYPVAPFVPVSQDDYINRTMTASGDVAKEDYIQIEGYEHELVSLRFYMAANKDHMPIRVVEIDWGDGLRQNRIGFYKNHQPQCKVRNDLGTPMVGPFIDGIPADDLEFAATESACREKFANYLHLYSYDPVYACGVCKIDNVETKRHCGTDAECGTNGVCDQTVATPTTDPSNTSCYRPRVMLQDNWGWCTNGVYGDTGLGCQEDYYNAFSSIVAPLLGNDGIRDGFVEWNGVVIVHKDPKP